MITSFNCSIALIVLGGLCFGIQFLHILVPTKWHRKIAKTAWILAFVTIFIGWIGINAGQQEKRTSDGVNKEKQDSLLGSIGKLYRIDSINFARIDTDLKPYNLTLKDQHVVPIINNIFADNHSQNVISNNQKAGQTGFNINNHGK